MKCQRCHDAESTIHFKEVADGNLREIHLCEACAAEKGFHVAVEHNKLSIASQFIWMAENLFPEGSSKVGAIQCDSCGLRYSQFARTGRLGCPNCYQAFQPHLKQVLRRIHGATEHKFPTSLPAGGGAGAEPEGGALAVVQVDPILALRGKLARAIEGEEYELAAQLRDEIRELQNVSPKLMSGDSDAGRILPEDS